MTKKDQSPSEEIELSKTEKDNAIPSIDEQESKDSKGSTEIKNAHATGDGAYGRSDKSVLGESESKDECGESETPY